MRAARVPFAVFAFLLFAPAPAALAAECEVLELRSVGIPSPSDRVEARKISCLRLFEGRLYVGTGDAMVNTGPAPVLALDPETGAVATEFTVDDEAVFRFRVLDGKLAIPGVDATESWELGNVYVREEDGWTKHRTLPLAVHVNDLASFGGAWFATTGTVYEIGAGNRIAAGSILFSLDRGRTWKPDYVTAASAASVFRVDSLVEFRGRLFAFPYGYADYPEDDVPEDVRKTSGAGVIYPDNGRHTLHIPDPQGPDESLVRTEQGWLPVDLVPATNVCRVRPIVFCDRLLLSTVIGRRVAPFAGYFLDGPVPVPGATGALFAFDGERTVRLDLSCDSLRDWVVRDGRLTALVLRGGHYHVVETEDLETWRWRALPLDRGKPLCLERTGETIWIGTNDGNLFRTTGETTAAGSELDLAGIDPRSFVLRAELPRDGRAYGGAITRWSRPGHEARARFETSADGAVRVSTENVDELLVQHHSRPVTSLEIDGAAVRVPSGKGGAILCSRQADGGWGARATRGDAEIPPQVIATADADVANGAGAISDWVAEGIRVAAGADVAFALHSGVRRGIAKGPVSVTDLFDLCYRDRIAVFEATGERILALAAANRAGEAGNRVAFAGLAGLDPAKEYRLAMPVYSAARGERFFGEALGEYETGGYVHTALIEHLLAGGGLPRER